jgi:hypothetical protein
MNSHWFTFFFVDPRKYGKIIVEKFKKLKFKKNYFGSVQMI